MTRISTFRVLLSFAVAATVSTVTYAVEVKVSVPHVQVPHVQVPHVQVPHVIAPHVNTGTSAHITGKVPAVRHLSKGSITEQRENKLLQDQLQQLQTNTNAKQAYRKLEGELEQAQDNMNQQISKGTFSILNQIDPAAKASVVFVGQQNLKNDNANTALGMSPKGAENLANGMQRGGAPGMAVAVTLAATLASSNGSSRNAVSGNEIAGSSSNASNGIFIGSNASNGVSSNGSNGGGIANYGIGGPSSNASNGIFIGSNASNSGGIFNNGTGGPSSNGSGGNSAGKVFPPAGHVMGIYSGKDSPGGAGNGTADGGGIAIGSATGGAGGGPQTKSKGVPNLVKGATYCTGPGCGGPPPK